jgi:hypothetical protein
MANNTTIERNKAMKTARLAMVLALMLAATTFAAPINKAAISGSANWYLHGDYEAFAKTKISQLVRAELAAQGIEQKLAEFKVIFSFHPIDDIKNITIYGRDKDPAKFLVVMQGQFNKDLLLNLVKSNPNYTSAEYGTFAIHAWADQKGDKLEPRFGAFFNDNTVVIGGAKEAVTTGLDVLAGKAESAAGKTLVGEPVKGAFLTVTAEKVGDIVKDDQNAAVFQQAQRLTLALGEKEGRTFITGALATKTPEEATTINQALQGMLAFVKLATQEKMPKVTELANAMKIVAENASVGLHFEWDTADLFATLKQAGEIKKQLDAAQQPQPQPKPAQ